MVIDQKAFTGGVWPLSKWITYLCAPSSGWLSASTKSDGYTASAGRLAPRPISATTARVP